MSMTNFLGNGITIVAEPKKTQAGGLFIPVVMSTGIKENKKATFLNLHLPPDKAEHYKAMKFKKGDNVNVSGSFMYSNEEYKGKKQKRLVVQVSTIQFAGWSQNNLVSLADVFVPTDKISIGDTKNGGKFVSFQVATDAIGEDRSTTRFYDVVAYGETAAIIEKMKIKKGSKLTLAGRIEGTSYSDENGIEHDGNPRIVIGMISYGSQSSLKKEGTSQESKDEKETKAQDFEYDVPESYTDIEDEDVPF